MYWYLRVLKNYVQFSGRASRREYWMFALYNTAIGLLLYVLGHQFGGGDKPVGIYGLLVVLPAFALSIRRLHDVNRSGWWVLLALIPIVGPLGLLYFKCKAGDSSENRFGFPPFYRVL